MSKGSKIAIGVIVAIAAVLLVGWAVFLPCRACRAPLFQAACYATTGQPVITVDPDLSGQTYYICLSRLMRSSSPLVRCDSHDQCDGYCVQTGKVGQEKTLVASAGNCSEMRRMFMTSMPTR